MNLDEGNVEKHEGNDGAGAGHRDVNGVVFRGGGKVVAVKKHRGGRRTRETNEGGKESAPESVSAGVATGISTTTVSKATAELFTIDGVKVPAQHLKKGIYIMRAADGSTRKVLVK